jgi:hypothetical protein
MVGWAFADEERRFEEGRTAVLQARERELLEELGSDADSDEEEETTSDDDEEESGGGRGGDKGALCATAGERSS